MNRTYTSERTYTPPQPFEEGARPDIELKPVESSQIRAVGFDPITNTLAIQFKAKNDSSAPVYCYPDVSQATYSEFINAASIGQYFGANLKSLPFKKYRSEA